MKTKLLSILTCFMMACVCVFSLTACENGGDDNNNKPRHKHSYTQVVTNPTCEVQGFTTYKCECGDKYINNYVNAMGHSFTNYLSDNNATYESDGTKTAKCDNCDVTDTIMDYGSKITPTDKSAFVFDNGTIISLTEYGKTLTNIVIPNNIDGVAVVGIGEWAFYDCDLLNSVTMNNSIISIGRNAFRDCSSITSLSIPDSVTSIGNSAFYLCDLLNSVTMGKGVKSIGSSVFTGCESLENVDISNGVTNIGDYAFSSCSSLKSIVIPDSVKSIGSSVFTGCKSLNSITIPFVGENASTSTSSISPFGYLFGTSSYTGSYGVQQPYYNSTSYTSSNGWYTYYFPINLKEVVITGGSISRGAFYNCRLLKSIIIDDNVTTIDKEAFYGCKSLTSVIMGRSVNSIGDSAFFNCTSLNSIVIPKELNYISGYTFYNCNSLNNIKFTGTIEEWKNLTKNFYWNAGVPATKVICTDGEVEL